MIQFYPDGRYSQRAEKDDRWDSAFESGSGLKRAIIFKRIRGLAGQGPVCIQTITVCVRRAKGARGDEREWAQI